MKKHVFAIIAVAGLLTLMSAVIAGQVEAKKQTTQLYYDGDFVTANLPNGGAVAFKDVPDNSKAYPFDPIYVFVDEDTNMPHAQNPVIGSVPGDKEYTGGRWQVFLVFGTSADDDDITSVDDLMDSDLEIDETSMYFSCPIIKK